MLTFQTPPTSGDTIIYANCQADMIKVWNAVIDTVGHYARPDILSLDYHAEPYQQIAKIYESSNRDDIDRIAEKNEVSIGDVDRKVQDMVK